MFPFLARHERRTGHHGAGLGVRWTRWCRNANGAAPICASCVSNRSLAAGEGGDECIDLLLIRTLASGVEARTRGVADPQHNLVRSRRVMDQHRRRIEGIEIPTLVEGPIDEIHARAGRAYLGVAWNDDATALD